MREPNQPEDYLQRLRHSTAHIMAYAVQQLFPDGERTVKTRDRTTDRKRVLLRYGGAASAYTRRFP